MDNRQQQQTQGVNMWDLLTVDDPGHVIGALPETKAKKRNRKGKKNKKETTAAADVDGEVVVTAAAAGDEEEEEAPPPRTVQQCRCCNEDAVGLSEYEKLRRAKAAFGITEQEERSPCSLALLGGVLKAVLAAGLVAFFYSLVVTTATAV